jgi:hypothetical protein
VRPCQSTPRARRQRCFTPTVPGGPLGAEADAGLVGFDARLTVTFADDVVTMLPNVSAMEIATEGEIAMPATVSVG